MSTGGYAGDISPKQAWDLLSTDKRAVLVDVRTPAEWNYVGIPDLSPLGRKPIFVPWMLFPSMQVNAEFALQLESVGLDPETPLIFLCRSGARSRAAAVAMTARGFSTCYNIDAGFEGDPDGARHRGTVSGWKVDGLPWMQG